MPSGIVSVQGQCSMNEKTFYQRQRSSSNSSIVEWLNSPGSCNTLLQDSLFTRASFLLPTPPSSTSRPSTSAPQPSTSQSPGPSNTTTYSLKSMDLTKPLNATIHTTPQPPNLTTYSLKSMDLPKPLNATIHITPQPSTIP